MKHFQKAKKYDTIGVNALKENKFSFDYNEFDIERPFDFTLHSSIGCGGSAKLAFYPRSERELKALLTKLNEDKKEWIALGNLTNVLPSDLGTEKIVVSTKKLKGVEISKENATVYAEAGVLSGVLLYALRKAALSGAEFLIGIPCTLGGALYMNAGAGGKYISEIVESVRVYREGEIVELPLEECEYSYKNSVFMQTRDMIVGGTLKLERSDEQTIVTREKEWKKRRAHLPKGKSMGCVFKNQQGCSAGELIEKTGLKGLRVGGAKVSERHANFIINDGNATAREIRALIKLIQNAVFAYCGVVLEEEIRYLS